MSAEDEEEIQLSNNCWICDTLFGVEDKKVRNHYHILILIAILILN